MPSIVSRIRLAGLAVFLIAAIVLTAAPAVAAQKGMASWYAMTSKTASGERASPHSMTAAHRTLRFGTRVRVTNLRNGRSVVVCVNDRGPFIRGRVIDVTKAAGAQTRILTGRCDAGAARRGRAKVAALHLIRAGARLA